VSIRDNVGIQDEHRRGRLGGEKLIQPRTHGVHGEDYRSPPVTCEARAASEARMVMRTGRMYLVRRPADACGRK
jgi:hypothetical protein